jgi:hypothetical protein
MLLSTTYTGHILKFFVVPLGCHQYWSFERESWDKAERDNLVPRLFVLTLVPRWNGRNELQNEEPGYEVAEEILLYRF